MRSRPTCTASSCASSRRRRAGCSARSPPDAPVVLVGSGAFLGREVAARLGRAVADGPWSATDGEMAPAAALAALLAARLC